MAAPVTKQHEERAKAIIARREGKEYKEPSTLFTGPTAKAQSETMAKKILAKRGEDLPPKEDLVSADIEIEAPAIPSAYIGMTKKQLKSECDKLGIEYHKKATNDALIELLTGA